MGKYDDILYMKRPVSQKHMPMSMTARAAQFAPFAALTGYDDAIEEETRETAPEIEPGEEEKERIGRTVAELAKRLETGKCPAVIVTYFKRDTLKAGGEYRRERHVLTKVRLQERVLLFSGGVSLHIENIREIEEII